LFWGMHYYDVAHIFIIVFCLELCIQEKTFGVKDFGDVFFFFFLIRGRVTRY
jgi:hypothetical protein